MSCSLKRLLFVFGLAVFAGACASAPSHRDPHIVVLIADDLGLDVAPCYAAGSPMSFLGGICAEAVVFERAYAHPYCTASRASLITGRHPIRHGANDVRTDSSKLPLSELTLPETIRERSAKPYRFAAFGKWHLADDQNGSHHNPNLQGFDHFEGTPRQHHTYRYFDYDWWINGELVGRSDQYRTSRVVDAALSYFERVHSDAPSMLWIGFTSPHKPYVVPPTDLHTFRNLQTPDLRPTLSDEVVQGQYRSNRPEPRFDHVYHAMLQALDTEIGRLVEEINARSDRPVLFLFLGDNGSAAEVSAVARRVRGVSKATLFDGGVRVPLVVWWGGFESKTLGSRRDESLVHLADLYPTLAMLAGVPSNTLRDSQYDLDGVPIESLASVRSGEFEEREFLFLERGNADRLPFAYAAVDADGIKLIVRESDRPVRYRPGVTIEAYDTALDPDETTDLMTLSCSAPEEELLDLLAFIDEKVSSAGDPHGWFDVEQFSAEIRMTASRCSP